MPKVDININGRIYPVACDPGQEDRVRDLAAMLDSRMRQLAGPNPASGVGETHLLVLAGLMLADELTEASAARPAAPVPAVSAPLSPDDEDLLVAAVDHLTSRIEDIAARLERT